MICRNNKDTEGYMYIGNYHSINSEISLWIKRVGDLPEVSIKEVYKGAYRRPSIKMQFKTLCLRNKDWRSWADIKDDYFLRFVGMGYEHNEDKIIAYAEKLLGQPLS